jgi:hypothetical protein
MVAAGFAAVTGSMVVAVSTVAAMAGVSTVVEDHTEEAAGNRNSIFLSHLNGWQPMLPAVFLLPSSLFRISLPGTPFS